VAFLLVLPLFAAASSDAVQSITAQIQSFVAGAPEGSSVSDSAPVQPNSGITGLTISDRRIADVSMGAGHTLAITEDGALWAWGRNSDGQLGIGATGGLRSTPQQVMGGASTWQTVSAGQNQSFGIGTDGTLWVWGSARDVGRWPHVSSSGQLGLGDSRIGPYNTPQQVTGGAGTWRSVYAAGSFTLAIGTDNTLWAWGYGIARGLGDIPQNSTPQQVMGGAGTWQSATVISRAVNSRSTMAIGTDGSLWAWGHSHSSIGVPAQLAVPQPVVGGAGTWQFVTLGNAQSFAIGTDGTLWGMGINQNGIFDANPSGPNANSPQQITILPAGVQAESAILSTTNPFQQFAGVLDQQGRLWTWGYRNQAGLGSPNTWQLTPQQVPSSDNWQGIFTSLTFRQNTSASGASSQGWGSSAIDASGALRIWTMNSGNFQGMPANGIVGIDTIDPWRVAASVVPAANNTLARHNGATLPANGANMVIDTDFVYVFFDRLMCEDPASLGDIVITTTDGSNIGASVDVNSSLAGWATTQAQLDSWGVSFPAGVGPINHAQRGIQSVFRAPLTLTSPDVVHQATVSRFLCASFGVRGTLVGDTVQGGNEMYPYSWTFTPFSRPMVVSVEPTGTAVATTTPDLIITFDRLINETGPATRHVTLNGHTLNLTAPGVTWTTVGGSSVLTIPFSSTPVALEYSESYTVVISGFADAGNPESVMFAPYTHVFATEGSIVITKRLLMPEGTTTPNTAFEFEIAPHSLNGDSIPQALANLPALNNNNEQTITYTSADTQSVNATQTIVIERISQNLLTGVEFPFAGIFSYLVTEVSAGTTQAVDSGTMYFDPSGFVITFEVENLLPLGSGHYVTSIHINRVNPDGSIGAKVDGPLVFTNVFMRQQELTISKEITGALANLTRLFSFEVTVISPYLVRNPVPPMQVHAGYTAYIKDSLTGTTLSGPYLFASGVSQTIQLGHNQELVFVDTHVGTRYDVTETGVANYRAQVTVTANTVASAEQTGTTGQDFTLSDYFASSYLLVGEGVNVAAFVNVNRVPPPTGILQGSFVPVAVLVLAIGMVVAGSIWWGRRRAATLEVLTQD